MGSLVEMGGVSGGSFTESIVGKRLVASTRLGMSVSHGSYNSSYGYLYTYTGGEYQRDGSGIASIKFLNKGNSDSVTIKVDGVQLDDYSHFVDYRRGRTGSMVTTPSPDVVYAGSNLNSVSCAGKKTTPIMAKYTGNGGTFNVQVSLLIEDEGSYDFLTIPFHDSFYIKLSNWSYWTSNNRPQGYNTAFQASIAVWEDD